MPTLRSVPGTKCSVGICQLEIVVKGMCWGHYRRALRGVELNVALEKQKGNSRAGIVRYGPRRPSARYLRAQIIKRWLTEEMVSPEPNTGCWIWLGELHPVSGYGLVGNHLDPWGRYAHRAQLFFGGVTLPKGRAFHVRHYCDNPQCVSPHHLTLGTAAENMADRDRRGRSRKGNGAPIRTVCKRSHVGGYYVNASGTKVCRVCQRIRSDAAYQRKHSAHGATVPLRVA